MRTAFTLIELLVVVTIIVVLLALLAPALDSAMEAALRAKCAANLHAFGLAIPHYAMDNRRKLLRPVQAFGGPYPSLVRNRDVQGPGQWSGEGMQRYVGGVDLVQRVYGPQWYCPSNGKKPAKDAENARTAGQSPDGGNQNQGWLALDYAYFANIPENRATKPEQLLGTALGAGKLLMADTIYYWQGGGNANWWLNHHAESSSTHHAAWGGPVLLREQIRGLSGTNQLLGDSSVFWKNGDQFKPDLMWQPSTEVGFVSPGGLPTQDLNFY